MGQHSPRPAGKNSSHPFALASESAVAKGEDPVVERHQPTAVHPRSDQPPLNAHLKQLPTGDHSVLALGQFSNFARRTPPRPNANGICWLSFGLRHCPVRLADFRCNA
jgi:hypothetical protein